MAASHGLRVQTRKLAQSYQFISYAESNTENSNDNVHELALEKYS